MGKRKQSLPKLADEVKRQQLNWNMTDGMSPSKSFVINSDPSVLDEDTNFNDSITNKSPTTSSFANDTISTHTPDYAVRIDTFYQNLALCQSRLTLHNGVATIDCNQLLHFGDCKVKLLPHPSSTPLPHQLPHFKECWLYVVSEENLHMLYFEIEDYNENITQKKTKSRQSKFGVYWFASINVPIKVLTGLKTKSFKLICNEYSPLDHELSISIFGNSGVVMQLSHPSEIIRINSTHLAIQRLMEFYYEVFFPYCYEGREIVKGHNFFQLYENIMMIQRENLSEDSSWPDEIQAIHHSCLKPVLRQYQKESVAWMLRQELKKGDENQLILNEDIHPLYSEVRLRDGKTFYYNTCAGSLIRDRPKVIQSTCGGILADEMGLGKTVEFLCCMLLHPRQGVELPEPLPVIEDEEEMDEEEEKSESEIDKSKENSTHSSRSGEVVSTTVANDIFNGDEQCPNMTKSSDNVTVDKPLDSQHKDWAVDSVSSSKDNSDNINIDTSNDAGEISTETVSESCQNQNCPKNQESNCGEEGNINNAQPQPPSNLNKSHEELNKQIKSCEDNGVKTTDSNKKVKRKRKSRGIVEFVPITDCDDVGYFSSKPARRKQFFECNCGQLDHETDDSQRGFQKVSCLVCGMSQHAECMNYDLKDPHRGPYLCPHCHAVSCKIKSGATLIISPTSICHQWIDEIRKHIKECSIKVFIYTGVSKQGYIQPQTLAMQDIVITTYDVLRKELDFVDLPHTNSDSGRRFRHPKRFLATPSPLVAVEWWRICLDEAQMVECVTTKTAEMALRLKSVNRWCVTGTPLMRSVEDIYGLLLFLGMDPFHVQQWFKLLIWDPFCRGIYAPMHHTLAQVFWRTTKTDVLDQIDLPSQKEEVNWLTFSPVEEHFYRRQYEVYQRNSAVYKQRYVSWQNPGMKLHALDRKTMSELLSPLFRLRQACCHPQIVRGAFLPLNKMMMNMDEVLEHMTKKVKTECEEAHRQIVASLNGLAGLAIIKRKFLEAADKYRDVLRSVEEHKNQFRTDDLQQLHAIHNLANVIDQKPKGLSPTLRDDTLREQCEELKEKYMTKASSKVVTSQEALKVVSVSREELVVQTDQLDGDWWADIIDMTVQRGIDEDLIDKVKDDLLKTTSAKGSIADAFNHASGLMYIIDNHLQMMSTARNTLSTKLIELAADESPDLVQNAAMCCMRPIQEILNVCAFCKVHEMFNEYESKLFMYVERGLTVAGDDSSMSYQVSTKRQGTWADSEVEKVLKAILAFYRLNFTTDRDVLDAANLQIKYLDVLKKEFKNFRALWMSHRERISAIDELAMATERLRLREEFEPESATKILNVIEVHELNHHELKCSSDEIVGRSELRKKQGQLLYLTNLAKQSRDGMEHNPDLCPVCQSELGVEWSVLLCGHCYCLQCIRTLIDRGIISCYLHRDQRIKCPLCRDVTTVKEIAYVTTKKKEETEVKGSHSTKIQAVLDCLIKIRRKDPAAKSLVFSMWVSVLDILAAALIENNIPYRALHEPSQFQKNLSSFKKDNSIQVLLLPLHSGANGLNLIEANHVLLVEPELNLEEESQAISRIYRIGQTRQTKIHRFLVRGTIEEKIFHMVKSLRESKEMAENGNNLELTVGHIVSLLQQPAPDEEDENGEMIGMGVERVQMSTNTEAGPSCVNTNRDDILDTTSNTEPGPSGVNTNRDDILNTTNNTEPGPSGVNTNRDDILNTTNNTEPGPSGVNTNRDDILDTTNNTEPGPCGDGGVAIDSSENQISQDTMPVLESECVNGGDGYDNVQTTNVKECAENQSNVSHCNAHERPMDTQEQEGSNGIIIDSNVTEVMNFEESCLESNVTRSDVPLQDMKALVK